MKEILTKVQFSKRFFTHGITQEKNPLDKEKLEICYPANQKTDNIPILFISSDSAYICEVMESITNKYQEAQQELVCNVQRNADDDEQPMEVQEAAAQLMEVDEAVTPNESNIVPGDSMVKRISTSILNYKLPDCFLTQAVCAASCIFFQVILEGYAQKYFFNAN